MKHEIKCIGVNYPKVGDTIWWRDSEDNISEDIVLKIEQEDNPDLETMYFISLTENGGGCFVTEDCLLQPFDMSVKLYKEELARKKADKISTYLKQEEVRTILYERLRNYYYDEDEASRILDVLSNII